MKGLKKWWECSKANRKGVPPERKTEVIQGEKAEEKVQKALKLGILNPTMCLHILELSTPPSNHLNAPMKTLP